MITVYDDCHHGMGCTYDVHLPYITIRIFTLVIMCNAVSV